MTVYRYVGGYGDGLLFVSPDEHFNPNDGRFRGTSYDYKELGTFEFPSEFIVQLDYSECMRYENDDDPLLSNEYYRLDSTKPTVKYWRVKYCE